MAAIEKKSSFASFEAVTIGDESSRLSKTIFVLLCLMPCFSTILFGAVDNITWMWISVLAAIMFLLWLGEEWNAGGFLINTSPLQLPLIGLIAIGLVQILPFGSFAISLDPYATRFFVIRLVVYLVFFSMCLVFINSERRLKKIVWLVVIFGSLMAFVGILQRIAHTEGIYGLRETPQSIPFGPFVNQHHFAAFMEMTGGVALAFLFAKSTGRDKRLLLAIAISLMGIALIFTGSRGGLIGFAASVAFVVILNVFSIKKRGNDIAETSAPPSKIIFAVAGMALIAIIFGVVILLGGDDSLLRGVSLGAAQSDISNGRTHFWSIAIKIFLNHPIIGAGLDAFGVAFTRYDFLNGTFRVEQAHNDYLQTLADAGILGFICVGTYIYFLFRKGFAIIADAGAGFRRNAAIGALAGCLGILVHSFFDFPLRTPSNAFFFLLLSAVAVLAVKAEPHAKRRRRPILEATAHLR